MNFTLFVYNIQSKKRGCFKKKSAFFAALYHAFYLCIITNKSTLTI
jgi:hypothetical protein